MAAGAASGTLRRRGDRRVGPVGDGEELSWQRVGVYHPALLLGLLVYGYTTGVFSSRKLERATYDLVAFRFIAANDHPDHDTIATFRRRFLKEIEALFVRVLQLAREMGVLKMGTVALDGTKIHANASRHSALSYEHAGKIEEQLKAEVAELLAKAEAADQADFPMGCRFRRNWPGARTGWRKIAEARAKIEARARERYERELAEHEAKLAARAAKAAATGPAASRRSRRPRNRCRKTQRRPLVRRSTAAAFPRPLKAEAVFKPATAGETQIVTTDVAGPAAGSVPARSSILYSILQQLYSYPGRKGRARIDGFGLKFEGGRGQRLLAIRGRVGQSVLLGGRPGWVVLRQRVLGGRVRWFGPDRRRVPIGLHLRRLRRAGGLDLGDDGFRLRRARLCRLPDPQGSKGRRVTSGFAWADLARDGNRTDTRGCILADAALFSGLRRRPPLSCCAQAGAANLSTMIAIRDDGAKEPRPTGKSG